MALSLKTAAVMAGALAIAGWVATASWALANQRFAAPAAMRLPAVPTGEAAAFYASQRFAMRRQSNEMAQPTAHELANARAVYRREPLSVMALALAIAPGNSSNTAEFRKSIETVGALSRRNPLLNALAVNAYARAGDVDKTFRWISRSAKVDTSVEDRYTATLAAATAQRNAVTPLLSVLSDSPAWADSYWRAVVRVPAALDNAALVRSRLAQAPVNDVRFGREERDLLDALVNASSYDSAFMLVRAFPAFRAAGRGRNLLQNDAFRSEPLFAPFDWSIENDGEKVAAIDTRGGGLQMSALGGAQGHFVRQLVNLQPGRYAVGWESEYFETGETAAGAPRLEFRIDCGDRNASSRPISLPLRAGKAGGQFTVSGTCRWYWAGVAFAPSLNSADPFDARLEGVALIRIGDAPAASPQPVADAAEVEPQDNSVPGDRQTSRGSSDAARTSSER